MLNIVTQRPPFHSFPLLPRLIQFRIFFKNLLCPGWNWNINQPTVRLSPHGCINIFLRQIEGRDGVWEDMDPLTLWEKFSFFGGVILHFRSILMYKILYTILASLPLSVLILPEYFSVRWRRRRYQVLRPQDWDNYFAWLHSPLRLSYTALDQPHGLWSMDSSIALILRLITAFNKIKQLHLR